MQADEGNVLPFFNTTVDKISTIMKNKQEMFVFLAVECII